MDGLRRLLHLIRAVTVVQHSPPAMADALVSAGLLPALAALPVLVQLPKSACTVT